MTNTKNTRKNNSTGIIFDYSLDTFEDLVFYLYAAMLAGALLSVVLILVVVYVLYRKEMRKWKNIQYQKPSFTRN